MTRASRSKRRCGAVPPGVVLLVYLVQAMAAAGPAHAQAIERHLPPQAAHGSSVIVTPVAPGDTDATPLGVALSAVTVLGPTEPVRTGVTAGLHLDGAACLNPTSRRRLARFLGRPLSRRLIAQVEVQIVRDYRAQGFPLVSVSPPEQEVSSGVLQVRVIEFILERKSAPGAKDPAYVLSRVRATLGGLVDSRQLAQDLDWLNRYPFANTSAVFQPGDRLGATNLVLQTTAAPRPFSVYAGYSTSGSPLTGFDRYFAGTSVALPGLHDAYASYQFTGSNDVLFYLDRPLNGAQDPLYLSHSGRVVIPTLPRQDIEASFSFVQSNEFGDFTAHQTTEEVSVGYRSALSNLIAILPCEAVVGVEARRETGRTLFADEPVQSGAPDVFQVYLGYSIQENDRFGHGAKRL